MQDSKPHLRRSMPQAVHTNSCSIMSVKYEDNRFFDHLNHFLQRKNNQDCFYNFLYKVLNLFKALCKFNPNHLTIIWLIIWVESQIRGEIWQA